MIATRGSASDGGSGSFSSSGSGEAGVDDSSSLYLE